uniref:Rho-GAP domain-containing protein n=1 Tax=Schistosoma mansoni TaxID=6183 RepID=A0A3Q0KSB6_SCHMA
MSLFRRFFTCISTDNYPYSYTTNLVQDNTKKILNNKNCIICHESVVTCLNNQSIQKQDYLSSSTTPNYQQLTTEESRNIQTTQPEAMSVCISCTDMLDNNKNLLSDIKMFDVTTSSYRYSLTHPCTTSIVTTNPTTTTLPTSTVTCVSMNDTNDINSTEKSISLQCSKFITRWIAHCPFQWSIKSSNQQKTTINNNDWQTTTIIPNKPTNPVSTQALQQDLLSPINKTIQTTNNEENVNEFIEECVIPIPVFNLFLYLAQEGVYAKDLFRRPGNIAQIKHILQRFASDQVIDWKDYNIHTVATVAKRVLFNIPNGLIGLKGEKQLLRTALLTQQPLNDNNQLKTIRKTSTIHLQDSSNLEISNNIKISTKSTENLHLDINEPLNTSSLNETNPNSHDKNEHHTNKECIEQLDDLLKRAIVITNIDTTQQSNTVNLLFSYGSIKQIYQLTPVDVERVQVFQNILKDLTVAHRQLTIMIFGILHQLVFNMAYNTANQNHELEKDNDELPNIPLLKLAEGVVKSVAGSMFHSCTSSILLINQTTQVLQSLVICFPVMDKQFTQFYWDILNNRYKLRKSKLTHFPGVKIIKPGGTIRSESCSFMLYSKSTYSTRIINAAGRLFCLKNSNSTNVTDNNNNINEVQTTPTSVISSAKHFCFPSKDSTRQLEKSKQYLSIHREASIESSFYQNINETNNQIKQTEIIVDQPVDEPLVTFTDAPEDKRAKMKDVKFSLYSKVDVHDELNKLLIDEFNTNLHSNNNNTIKLRRNHSRYHSLRRRQMENLTKRAEWFLKPTILPKLTLTLDQFKDITQINSLYNHNHPNLQTTMSTISLLNVHNDNNQMPTNSNLLNNSNIIQIMKPRILFTSSTNDLIQSNYTNQLDTVCLSTCNTSLLHNQKLKQSNLCSSLLLPQNYGHSYSSLLNDNVSSHSYVIPSNLLTEEEGEEDDDEEGGNSNSMNPVIYYRMTKHSLPYDYNDINRHLKFNCPDRLQSTSYDNFHTFSYPPIIINENNCDITPTSVSISSTNHTNTTTLSLSVKNDLFNTKLTSSTTSGLGIISKSDVRYSDWSIDRPVRSEFLSRRNSATLQSSKILPS